MYPDSQQIRKEYDVNIAACIMRELELDRL